MINQIIYFWRKDLRKVLFFYESKRSQGDHFFLYLFLFFILVNITCYWLAMVSAFPSLVFGKTFSYYFKVQFPVGIFGALFDSLSFFITIFIIRRALLTINTKVYIAHLSIDLAIAILATFWVVFVFIVSGWAVSFIDTLGQTEQIIQTYDHETSIDKRTNKYINTVNDALINPSKNIQNIYFGLIMGISAMLPTMVHFIMFLKSFFQIIISIGKGSKVL
ncbi:MAG: hypothetical protein CMF94_01845 [Candidatus Marinimicrobia bacterium]|nr:hypothetical protein [Candidatus Neomarinimicrobiota bacterium]